MAASYRSLASMHHVKMAAAKFLKSVDFEVFGKVQGEYAIVRRVAKLQQRCNFVETIVVLNLINVTFLSKLALEQCWFSRASANNNLQTL